MTLRDVRREADRNYLEQIVQGRTISDAAKVAGIGRQSLHRLMTRYGIKGARPVHRGMWG